MLRIEYTSQFKRDFKKITKRPIEDILEVGHVISRLQQKKPLADKFVDHSLSGDWSGFRDCHIKPDLVLIYRVSGNSLQLARIGSHSELF
ncbi:MAG: type II toxin-antitoxin system YafQ family toxin [Aliidiomarina sp.]|uniref:type II toxin-antitoxin system YafQ family toxin n=1 Tax=Aliidiomarina sp. TaxID=1872439 RepID=UPI0025BE5A50|nr:type II toxin-antitoxin system YafQ family toxin [Aliidiomarina sp.]MCH8501315.1 type II toxin-antitoxin system YafQ family toxin [Aliidiomarina sp.]